MNDHAPEQRLGLRTSDFTAAVVRAGRKAHACASCGRAIPAGEAHIEALLEAFQTGPRYCRECVAAHEGIVPGARVGVAENVPPRSYPDAIENPVDAPTVEGTNVTRPI